MKRMLLLLAALFLSTAALAAVNINTATQAELESLRGIGPVKAKAIIDYRNANGPFKSPEDIMKVKGIKEGEFGKIRNDISVSGATSLPPAPQKSAEKAAPAKQPAKSDMAKSDTTKSAAPSDTTKSAASSDNSGSDKETKKKRKSRSAKEDQTTKSKDESMAKSDKSKSKDEAAKASK